MKLSHIFTLVVVLHLGLLGSLLVFPGCQLRPQGDRVATTPPTGQPAHVQEEVIRPAPEASYDSQAQRLPPTRPSWNVASSQETEVIQGYTETSFNAIEVETDEMDTIVVASTVQERTSPLAAGQTYSVQRGDNLTRIAREHGVSLSELMEANSLNRNSVLQVGQTLKIPAAGGLAGPQDPSAPALSPSRIDQEAGSYQVKPGDTLGAIATRHGTTVDALRSANNISGSTIYAGQTLLIPAAGASVPPPPAPKPAAVETRSGESTYVVKPGDTLEGIARRHGVTVRDVASRNSIDDPRRLRAGATLVIPSSGSGGPAASPAPAPRPAPAPAPSASALRPSAGAVPAPAPAPEARPSTVVVEEFDFDDLEDIPVVPVQSSD